MTSEPPSPTSVNAEHVLVPLDGSELALRALPTARALAKRLGASVHSVTVAADERDAERARRLAEAALDVPAGDPRVIVTTDGDPSEVIVRRAEALGSCLVCLGTHGRGRLGGALVGSVARAVLQASEEAVVALGPMADNPGWSPPPRSWPEPLSVPRIVACVDGSEASEQVLPLAAGWARALDMSLTVLTVVEHQVSLLSGHREGDARDGAPTDPDSYIEQLTEAWRAHVPNTDGLVLRDPIGPASAIRTHLVQQPAGLVAVTTHARTGIRRVLLGAVAASIVHASVAPCLVAPVRP